MDWALDHGYAEANEQMLRRAGIAMMQAADVCNRDDAPLLRRFCLSRFRRVSIPDKCLPIAWQHADQWCSGGKGQCDTVTTLTGAPGSGNDASVLLADAGAVQDVLVSAGDLTGSKPAPHCIGHGR